MNWSSKVCELQCNSHGDLNQQFRCMGDLSVVPTGSLNLSAILPFSSLNSKEVRYANRIRVRFRVRVGVRVRVRIEKG